MFLLGLTVSLTKFVCFIGSISIKSIGTEDANTEKTGIRAAYIKSIYIGDASTCTNNTCIGTWNNDIEDDFIGDTRIMYAGSVGAVKCLRIHLWLS